MQTVSMFERVKRGATVLLVGTGLTFLTLMGMSLLMWYGRSTTTDSDIVAGAFLFLVIVSLITLGAIVIGTLAIAVIKIRG